MLQLVFFRERDVVQSLKLQKSDKTQKGFLEVVQSDEGVISDGSVFYAEQKRQWLQMQKS